MKQISRFSSYGVIFHDDYYLLSLLNRGANKGKYNLVGGKIKFGENPEKTFVREAKEEAGLEIDDSVSLLAVLSELHEWVNDDSVVETMHLIGIIHRLQLNSRLNCKENGDGESSDGCRWFHVDELNQESVTSMALEAIELVIGLKNEN